MCKFNDWGVPYSSILFFEGAVKGHRRVRSIKRERDIFFIIERDDNITLNTLLLNEYCFGLGALLKALEEFPDTEYIIYGGKWNNYTGDADEYAKENKIGIFNYGDFLGAINLTNPLNYVRENERENKKDPFRTAQ